MKKSKRIISLILCFILVFVVVPFTETELSAEADYTDGVITYTESDMTLRWSISNATTEDGAFCHIMQGMHVGTTYVYTAKTDDNGEHCVFYRTNIRSGESSLMNWFDSVDATESKTYSTLVGYADELVVRSVAENGVSSNYMYISTGKAPCSISRAKVLGENLYFTGCFETVDSNGNSFAATSVKWAKTQGGYHYFLVKNGFDFYYCKISVSDNGGNVESPKTITCYKIFDFDIKSALFSASGETKALTGIEEWTHNGFEYDHVNNMIYLAFFNWAYNRQSAVVTFDMTDIITDEVFSVESDLDNTVYPTKLSFLFTEENGVYFEVETCGFRMGQGVLGDLALYFNANSEGEREGIYSLSYTRHTEKIDSIVNDNSVIYTVRYDGNGSTSGYMENTNHISGIGSSLRKNSFSKEGYTFEGWYFYRERDNKWIYETPEGLLIWYTEGEHPLDAQKFLGADCLRIKNFGEVNGESVVCYAVWSKKASDNMLWGNSPIDMGSEFYGKIGYKGLFVSNVNGALALKGKIEDNSQTFRFVKQTDGSYVILSHGENLAFDVSGGKNVEGRKVSLFEANGTDAQKFYVYYINNSFYFRTVSSPQLLGVDENGCAILSGENKGDNNSLQLLKTSFDGYLHPTKEYSMNHGELCTAFVKNNATGRLLTASGDSVTFENAVWDDSQKWSMEKNPDGSYSFISVKSGKALSVIGASMGYGADVDMSDVDGSMSQSFYLHNSPEGYALIKPVYTNYIVDMDTNNFDVHIYPYGEGEVQKNAQRFEIISDVSNGISPVYFGTKFDSYVHTPAGKMLSSDGKIIFADTAIYGEKQLLTFEYDPAFNAYSIKDSSNLCVSVENSNDANGAKLVMASDKGLPSQRFYIYAKDAYYYISPVFSNKMVDLDSGNDITMQIYGTDFTNRRCFTIVKLTNDGKKPADLGERFTAKVKDISSGMYITHSYSSLAGSKDGFSWSFVRQTNGSYVIKNDSSNAVWEVLNGTTAFGTSVRSYDGRGLIYQNFFIYETEGGYLFQPCISAGAVTYNSVSNLTTVEAISKNAYGQTFRIIRPEDEPEELLLKENSKYSIMGSYLLGVTEETNVSEVISNFENEGIIILDLNKNILPDNAFVGTGFIVCLVDGGNVLDSLTVVIKGDIDGNGLVDTTDYLRIKGGFLGTYSLDNMCQKAADVDGSGQIDATDYLRVKSHFLGTYNIYE